MLVLEHERLAFKVWTRAMMSPALYKMGSVVHG